MIIACGERRELNYEELQKYKMHNDIDSLFSFMDEVKYFHPVIIKVYFTLIKHEYRLYLFIILSEDV